MAEPPTVMEKPLMKRLLTRSKEEPVNCAMGIAADGHGGLLLLDKIKAPRALERDLQKDHPGAREIRFGTAFVDEDIDPKLARFRINRAAPGLARLLVRTLKGTGFSKVEIVLDDGTVLEAAGDHEEEKEGEHQEGDTGLDLRPSSDGPDHGDAAALSHRLAALIVRIKATDASQHAGLAELAAAAQAHLRTGDSVGAATAIAELETALSGAGHGDPHAEDGAAHGFAKIAQAWIAAHEKVMLDLDNLQLTMETEFPAQADEIAASFQNFVSPLLDGLDTGFAVLLDRASEEADAGRREVLLRDARDRTAACIKLVTSSEVIAAVDRNPFVPMAISGLLTHTLEVLHKAMAS